MIRFDKSDRDVLAVCSCGWRHHAAGGSITASLAQADAAAHSHLGGPAHSVNELERRTTQQRLNERRRYRERDTP